MKLTVFGATGRTGRELVRQALALGHEVTAVVRDPAGLPAELRPGIEIVKADTQDTASVAATVLGRDAVISAIGSRDLKHPTTVCADSARALSTAIHATGQPAPPPRIVIASNSAMAPGPGDDPFTRFLVKPIILTPLLRHMIEDMRAAEHLVRASGLPWTIVRAGRLTDRQGHGSYRHAVDRNVPGGFQITRTDFATALLDAATNPNRAGHVLSVSN
jgi:uncharacterized protein YbjT (DUF2867 family)